MQHDQCPEHPRIYFCLFNRPRLERQEIIHCLSRGDMHHETCKFWDWLVAWKSLERRCLKVGLKWHCKVNGS